MTRYSICFIDEDEGQNSIFYNAFKDTFEVFTITPTPWVDSLAIIEEVISMGVDLLVVDFNMVDVISYNWTEIISDIRKRNKLFPVLIATSNVNDALDYVDDPNITCSKDIWWGNWRPEELEDFKKRLLKLIWIYNDVKLSITTELPLLQNKINENITLTATEEDRYVELNWIAEEISWSPEHTAKQFYSVETNKHFVDLIDKTDILIAKINLQ